MVEQAIEQPSLECFGKIRATTLLATLDYCSSQCPYTKICLIETAERERREDDRSPMVRVSVFCPKCHKMVSEVITKNNITKILQGKRTIMSLGRGSSVSGLSVVCPVGHKVLLDRYMPKPVPPWEIDEAKIDSDGLHE